MQEMTVLELFREKLFRSDVSETKSCSELNDEIKLRRLEDISSQIRKDEPYLLNNRGRKMLSLIGNAVNIDVINAWLHNDEMHLPPLELLCFLHRTGVMQITTFLYYKPEFCAEISSQLVDMVIKELPANEDQDVINDVVKIVLSSMINVGNHSLRELFSLSSSVMESFTSILIEALFTLKEDLKLDFLNLVIKERSVFQEGMKSFAAFLLSSLLLHDPKSMTFQTAIGVHHKQWTSQNIPVKFKSLYNQLETLLTKEGVMREVELVLDDDKVNLTHLLYVIALMSQHSDHSDHLDIVKASADKWFKEALIERNELHLGLALLVTRHHFAEVSKYFVSYANWFGSVQAKNVLTLNFFFEFLSKLVPFEPAVFLKIQVTKVPSGPSSCQDVISDYISLAKTRLSDMNQTYDYISLFNDFHETIEEQQESDVKRVLAHFSDNNEVNKAVLEASVFRKQYYEKLFLPCLLSAPRGSDKTRDQLIIKLNTIGKIPSSLYRVWSKSR